MKNVLLILVLFFTSCAGEKYINRGAHVSPEIQEEINNVILNGAPFPKTLELDYGFWHYKYTFKGPFNYYGIRTWN